MGRVRAAHDRRCSLPRPADRRLSIGDPNQAQLQAQFEKSTTTNADIAGYLAGVSKITNVDAFLNNYKVLKVALTAYGMEDAINQKGLLKQLLTIDPTQKTALGQRLGKANYLAFAQAYWSLSTDGGAAFRARAASTRRRRAIRRRNSSNGWPIAATIRVGDGSGGAHDIAGCRECQHRRRALAQYQQSPAITQATTVLSEQYRRGENAGRSDGGPETV